MPSEDFEKLKSRIAQAHREGIRVRLWNAPDFNNSWGQLIQLPVDFINTDHIDGLTYWLQAGHFKFIPPEK
jgi:alkaline phosphatase